MLQFYQGFHQFSVKDAQVSTSILMFQEIQLQLRCYNVTWRCAWMPIAIARQYEREQLKYINVEVTSKDAQSMCHNFMAVSTSYRLRCSVRSIRASVATGSCARSTLNTCSRGTLSPWCASKAAAAIRWPVVRP